MPVFDERREKVCDGGGGCWWPLPIRFFPPSAAATPAPLAAPLGGCALGLGTAPLAFAWALGEGWGEVTSPPAPPSPLPPPRKKKEEKQ